VSRQIWPPEALKKVKSWKVKSWKVGKLKVGKLKVGKGES